MTTHRQPRKKDNVKNTWILRLKSCFTRDKKYPWILTVWTWFLQFRPVLRVENCRNSLEKHVTLGPVFDTFAISFRPVFDLFSTSFYLSLFSIFLYIYLYYSLIQVDHKKTLILSCVFEVVSPISTLLRILNFVGRETCYIVLRQVQRNFRLADFKVDSLHLT